MERYQAILDQLKQAQSRGMETITNRLDFVVQSLEELIQEAKSSVRGALPESADECLPVAEVERALADFNDEAEAQRRRADDLESRVATLESAGPAGASGASIELLRTLDGARSQSELLREMLPALSEEVARAVVLVLRDGTATAWSGIGFRDGDLLRSWRAEIARSPALSLLLEDARPVKLSPSDDAVFVDWLAEEMMPEEIVLIPVVLRGKLMGTVYVDRLDGQPWRPEAAQTLIAQVCWLIDTLQFRNQAAPSLAEPATLAGATAAAAPDLPTDTGADEIETEPATDEPDAAPAPSAGDPVEDPSATMKIDLAAANLAVSQPDEVPVEETPTLEQENTVELDSDRFAPDEPEPPEPEFDAAPEPEFEPSETDFEPGAEEPADRFEPDEPVTAEIAEPEASTPDTAEIPVEVRPVAPPEPEEPPAPSETRFLDEPPPVQPVQPPPDEPEEELSDDEAQLEEARRFARLLVSEIKLYNEEQVERGRELRDLYKRLQEDIDRSREMFDKRISPEIRARQDFFQDELVRILADGDPELLGM